MFIDCLEAIETHHNTNMAYSRSILFISLLVTVLTFIVSVDMVPILPKSDKDVVIDVSPFFKMNLHREPSATILDIDVLSGLVKVGYDRLPGKSPNVDVQVFGIGNYRNRPKYIPPDSANPDGEVVKYV